ncbi:MAG: transglycosylase SLT domain-containing protein [Deltaproteobacteria bacterium]|nr:transglycosylase SLT domain-containing protein [Deltaproteobacteria bacterium]
MQKSEVGKQRSEARNDISFWLLPLGLCLFFFFPAHVFASEAAPVIASSQDEIPLTAAATDEQHATLEEVAPQETQEKNGQNVGSEEDQAVQGPNDLAAETSDDENEDGEIAYDVPVVVNDKVEFFIRYFQTTGRRHFEKWLARSKKYLPMLKDIFRQNDLPEDLAYLPLIESGFNPNAKSRARAVGMWQFMQWTGKKYGLKIDFWVDERRDPEKATWAAANYLKDLYGIFTSWYLAAASYNAGEGRILRAMKKHKTDDFWLVAKQKRALKRETRDYIPKYIAALIIAKEPAKYGFADIEYQPQMAYEKVSIPVATDLRVIAKACECSLDDIRKLNPQLLRWFTPPTESPYEIKLPKEKAAVFHTNFAMIPPQERLTFLVHKLKKGETLSLIAKKYGAPLDSILYLNKIKNARQVRAGSKIVVPVRPKKMATPETVSSPQRG